MQLTPLEVALIDRWQRDLPLVARPFAAVANELGTTEAAVLAALERLSGAAVLSRVGAVLRPNTAGASTLVAMGIAPEHLESVAAIINEEPGVNHNYAREHEINLWFVLTGRDRAAIVAALARIAARTGREVLDLPLERSYYIDLGFPITGDLAAAPKRAGVHANGAKHLVSAEDRALLERLENGLALVASPYAVLAAGTEMDEADVLARLRRLAEAGTITRLGLIVRHRALGFAANAMAVWDVPDDVVDGIGERLAAEPAVTLCYRRPRRLPLWPYNLFCMIHGRERAIVAAEIAAIAMRAGISNRPSAILFSTRCFRQRGARLKAA
jgi:DNA-binding Lrp family transcriptional regulator